MAKEVGFDKYKTAILAVAGCTAVAIIICIWFSQGPASQETVQFSRFGVPHCPYCFKVVLPHTDFCESCKRSFRWTNTFVTCPTCNGTGECPYCLGYGFHQSPVATNGRMAIKDRPWHWEPCWYCNWGGKAATKTEYLNDPDLKRVPGACPTCYGRGVRRFGNGPVEYYDQRK